ncbi:MAG: hypothetical protein AB7H80_12320 [Candidatus Kapaibacterium sp.]
MSKASTIYFLFTCCTISLLSLISCNDNPSQIGEDYLPENVEFTQIDLPISDMTFTSGVAAISNTSNQLNNAILVGQADDGTVAHSLLTLIERSDELKDIAPSSIVRAELRMRTIDYRYGDTNSRRVNFDVVSMEGIFGSNAQWADTLIAKIDNGITLGTYDGDYLDSSFTYTQLDPTKTADFLNSYFSLDTVVSNGDPIIQTQTLRTLALKAGQSGGMIGAFLGTAILNVPDSLRPTLVVTLADTVIELEMGVSNWITKLPPSVEIGAGKIVLGAGAPIRTHVQFNLDTIPSNAVIHSAELTFHIVPGEEKTGTTGDVKALAGYVAGSNPLGSDKYLADISTLFSGFLIGSRPAADDASLSDTYRFRAFGFVLIRWLRGGSGGVANNGLLLALSRNRPEIESATLDRVVLYGPDAPEELRPRLRIVYSIQVKS